MTRFLLPLERAVDAVLDAVEGAAAGETWVPRAPSARIVDVATALMGDRKVPIELVGIRPGEKVHEVLVSAEEAWRTSENGDYLVIEPVLPELRVGRGADPALNGPYSSADAPMTLDDTRALLARHELVLEVDGLERASIGH
jgi:UDP-glucose 4-epimerase